MQDPNSRRDENVSSDKRSDDSPRTASAYQAENSAGNPAANSSGDGDDNAPDNVTDIPSGGWRAILKRSLQQFGHDDITDRAAALTYYGVLSIFPGMLVLISLLGLIGRSNTNAILANIGQVAPGGVSSFLKTVIHQVEGRAGAASVGAIVGLLIAIWSASGYVAGFMRAGNAIYEIEEGRPFYVKIPVRVGTTIALMVLLLVATIIVVVTGPVASQVGQAIGLGNTLVTVWDIAKWPVLVVLVSIMFSLLYWATPNVKQPGFRWVTPGGIVAVVIWLIASGGFALYVSFSNSYNKTYGSLATVIIFLVWLWISNIAILLGMEFNSETERQRAIEAGMPEDLEPYVEVRSTKKMDPDYAEEVHQAQQRLRETTSDEDGNDGRSLRRQKGNAPENADRR